MGAIFSFFSALSFLTIVPVPAVLCGDEKRLAKSPYFFPLVGLLLGGIIVGVDFLLRWIFDSQYLVNGFVVLFLIGFSKALHLDGLADSADGFLSSRPRDRMLEIMRDSRIGSAGALAIFGIILLKWSALMSLPSEVRGPTLLLMPLAGRCALLFHLSLLPYARKDGGLASIFMGCSRLLMILVSLLFLSGTGYYTLSLSGLVVALAGVLFAALFSLYCYRRIGGFTGDTLGAVCELSELVPPLVMVACGGTAWAFWAN